LGLGTNDLGRNDFGRNDLVRVAIILLPHQARE